MLLLYIDVMLCFYNIIIPLSAAQVPRSPLAAPCLGADRDVRIRKPPRPNVLGYPHSGTERGIDLPIVHTMPRPAIKTHAAGYSIS